MHFSKEGANAATRRVLEKEERPEYLCEWALSLACLGRIDEAVNQVAQACTVEPENAQRWLLHGDALSLRDDYEAAIASYKARPLKYRSDY